MYATGKSILVFFLQNKKHVLTSEFVLLGVHIKH